MSIFLNTVRLTRFGVTRFMHKSATKEPPPFKYVTRQVMYLESELQKNEIDWDDLKNNLLQERGNINEKNFDGVLLKIMTQKKIFDVAKSFVDHLRNTNDELSLGATNGLLALYCEMSKVNKLPDDAKKSILDIYTNLYKKYKVLDYTTSEKIIQALCCIGEWEKALKVLDEIYLSSIPSHSAYSKIIATLFNLNKKKKAMEIIEKAVAAKRPLQNGAYEAWMNYILRKYKDKKIIAKYMDEICSHIMKTYATINEVTANQIKEIYSSVGWNAKHTKISKSEGRCQCCSQTLDCLKLSEEEFQTLQSNIKDKLIIKSDLFLNTSPQELEKFLNFLDHKGPFDVILDALNITYSTGKNTHVEGVRALNNVVEFFINKNKRVLILGRKHILNWKNSIVTRMLSQVSSFFTDNLSQDDPYIITAAILSGSSTDILSKDLLRSHTFQLKDEYLRILFKRWQWQHQWMISTEKRMFKIQPPLSFTPCPQKKDNSWHIPYVAENEDQQQSNFNDGTPNLHTWLCLQPKIQIKDLL